MSAICGIWGRKGQSNVSAELALVLSGLSHRGIDGVSSWCKDNIGLGIQHLWVTPESKKEKLPYYDPDLQLAIVADMRLDNRASLLSQLSLDNSILSDSQIVLLGYRTWGKEVVQKLCGEFAIVIWDANKQQLILINDHCGIRSIYYYLHDDYLVFSSEIKALLKLPFVPCKPHLRQIAKMDFFVQPENPGETYFEHIYALPSATVWTVSPSQAGSLHTYWQPNPTHRIIFKREEEYVEYFQSLFADVVHARLRSAYPVASTLSGGLDSSSITAMAASLLAKENQSLRTYSVIKAPEYADQCVDEQEFIDCFNDTPNLNRSYISDIWRGPFDDLEALIFAGESPDFTSRHFHLSAFASQMKQRDERVLMIGQYGEAGPSFNGQGYYAELFIRGKIGRLIDELRAVHRRKGTPYYNLIKYHLMRPLMPMFLLTPRKDLLSKQMTSCIRPQFKLAQLGKQLKYHQKKSFELAKIGPNHHVNQHHIMSWMIQEQKAKYKFVGYQHLEMTYPFLDHRLLEFCLAIPGYMKMNRGIPRYLVRAGMRNIMPEALCHRVTKHPFSPDYHIRYNRQRHAVLAFVNEMAAYPLVQEIMDIARLKQHLAIDMPNNQILTPEDFTAMISVPHMVYLLSFLKSFFIG